MNCRGNLNISRTNADVAPDGFVFVQYCNFYFFYVVIFYFFYINKFDVFRYVYFVEERPRIRTGGRWTGYLKMRLFHLKWMVLIFCRFVDLFNHARLNLHLNLSRQLISTFYSFRKPATKPKYVCKISQFCIDCCTDAFKGNLHIFSSWTPFSFLKFCF